MMLTQTRQSVRFAEVGKAQPPPAIAPKFCDIEQIVLRTNVFRISCRLIPQDFQMFQ